MSLLELFYLDEEQAAIAIAVARQWCADNGYEMGSQTCREAISVAVRLVKHDDVAPDIPEMLAREMAKLAPAPMTGLVMVVEDEPLIAMDLEWHLENNGFEPVSFSTCAEARGWLARNEPGFAVLDVQLKEGPCIRLAEELAARDIPFVVSSGSNVEHLPASFRKGIFIPKPCEPAALTVAFLRCVQTQLQGA